MRLFSRLAIRQKLIAIIMLVSVFMLALGSMAFVFNDRYTARDTLIYIVSAQASIIGANSTAAMTFSDRGAASEILQTLATQQHIVAAHLFTLDGRVFADYRRADAQFSLAPIRYQPSGHVFDDGRIHLFQPVLLEGQAIGTVHISADLDQLYGRVIDYSGIMFVALLLALVLSLLLSAQLQRTITRPILRLAEAARAVSRDQDYGLRVTKSGEDELGVLVDGFNEMLDQIQQRDEALERHAEMLEVKVVERTRELEDLTEQYRVQAYHDSLTGLPNRVLFLEHLMFSLSQGRRNDQTHAVLFIDIDGFKGVNDTLGHDAGDEVLKVIAKRLTASIRESDIVSRLGGDEFTVLLSDVSDKDAVSRIAATLVEQVGTPVSCLQTEVLVTASIGIAMYPQDGGDGDELLKLADIAMYHAKTSGKNNYRFFVPEMRDATIDRHTMETALRAAVRRDELTVHYQPRVDTAKGKVIAVEALVRWDHPVHGIIGPAEFIEIAEESGQIMQIGEFVLRRACETLSRLNAGEGPSLKMAVNLSMQQLSQVDLLTRFQQIIDETGVQPEQLQFEITERSMMYDAHCDMQGLQALKQMGVSLALDDFGAGCTGLSQLRRIPLDQLKIDRSFIAEIQDEGGKAIVLAVIALAGAMNMDVVAEGVESTAVAKELQAMGCDKMQGQYFAPPVAAEALPAVLAQLREQLTEGEL